MTAQNYCFENGISVGCKLEGNTNRMPECIIGFKKNGNAVIEFDDGAIGEWTENDMVCIGVEKYVAMPSKSEIKKVWLACIDWMNDYIDDGSLLDAIRKASLSARKA